MIPLETTFSWKKDLLITLIILLPFTLIFWFTNADLYLQSLFFDEKQGWTWIDHPFWDFIYRYGIFFGYAVALISLILISISYWSPKFTQWRKPAILMVFVIALGPGILVNLTFKEHWGRPRPHEVIEFGGSQEFKYVWQMGEEGKSFPCGHCSMGFYLAIPYLFWRKRRKLLAYFSLFVGFSAGFVIGFARVIAGAHFPSDVLWAGGMVWLTGILGFYLLKVYKPIPEPRLNTQQQKKRARLVTILMGIFLPILTISLLLATPYISKKEFKITEEEIIKTNPAIQSLKLDLGYGEVKLGPNKNKEFDLKYKVNAFGFPNSKLRYDVILADTASFHIYPTGWFTEIRNKIEASYPLDLIQEYELIIKKGKLFLEIPQTEQKLTFKVKIEKGDVHLSTHPQTDFELLIKKGNLKNQTKNKLIQTQDRYFTKANASIKIELELQEGIIILEN